MGRDEPDRGHLPGWLLMLAVLLSVTVGCGPPKPPPLAVVEGRVTIDGKPVPLALVTYVPLFEGFGAEVIAEGISDDDGRYTLSGPLGSGACVGRHKVTVSDAPSPDDARDQSVAAQRAQEAFRRRLTNRPIGARFGSVIDTPLEVEVTEGGGPYDLELTR
ncbi:MAG: hypothetical protein RLZZ440_3005 [Planctomycetota bacterium]